MEQKNNNINRTFKIRIYYKIHVFRTFTRVIGIPTYKLLGIFVPLFHL